MALITFSGLASGIDSSALIEAMLEQERTVRVIPFEKEIDKREETNSAFDELKTLLGELNTAAQAFRTLNGGAIAKNVSSSDETVLTATASNAAEAGTYSLNVSQLAKNGTFSFDDRFTSSSDAINSSINNGAAAVDRTVSFTVGQGANSENIDIEITSGTSLTDFVTEFNEQSEFANASVVNTGTASSPSYAIVIQSKYEGQEKGTITLNSVGTEVQTAGAGAFTTNTLDQAQDLQFTLGGVTGTITRSSNTVTDVIEGVSFTASGSGASTLSISTDTGATESLLSEFVEKYNAVVEFIAENDSISEEQTGSEITNVFGPLASTSLDDGLLSALRAALTGAGTSGRTVNILADLGVTTQRDGTLAFDTEKFQSALADDAEGVELILGNLGESLGAVDGTIAQYTRFNGLIDEAVGSNDSRIEDLQKKIQDAESAISEREKALVAQFARLESQISQLQSQQNSLTSLLPAG